jgi:hypothetical protein
MPWPLSKMWLDEKEGGGYIKNVNKSEFTFSSFYWT